MYLSYFGGAVAALAVQMELMRSCSRDNGLFAHMRCVNG